MPWHDKHFPTFKKFARAFWQWWNGRDLFEKGLVHIGGLLIVLGSLYWIFLAPPAFFPSGSYVEVPVGASLSDISSLMQSRDIVSYTWVLKTAARILGSDKHIPAGEYYFPQPENAVEVAIHLISGDFQTTPVKVTIPEGSTVNDVANILLQKLPGFNKRAFLDATQGQEGYLFPDTYFFLPGESTEAILSVFNNDLNVQLLKIQPQITTFGKPLPEVLTMASLLEKEAPDLHDRQIIAGILWHRIQIGMPLEVDAVFPYILGKSATELTTADLAVQSPYNTYIHTGLPPGPIANPGLVSIQAAVTPIETNYLYYLSDNQGNFHFATTYTQFLAYKREYLGT